MEMRKFIIELHADGSMTWSEYIEPNTREDQEVVCSRALQRAADDLEAFPCRYYSPSEKDAYLAGAARMAAILRKAL